MGIFALAVYFSEILLITVVAIILYDPLSYWAHRKGYSTPNQKWLVVLPLMLGALGSILILNSWFSRGNWGNLTPAEFIRLFVLIFVPLPVGIGGSFLVLRLLPKRKMRLAGSRRSGIPFAGIGYASIILAVPTVILSLWAQQFYFALQCVSVTFTVCGMTFYLARRANTPTVEEGMLQDQRPPLLYLRSFDQEAQGFAKVSHDEATQYSEITSFASFSSYYLTLEQFLAREVQKTIGPLIALGNPTDYLPPEGAVRTYAADGNWQEYFTDLSKRSAGILMQMGNTDNLNWELVSIRERGLQTKLFVVTPPPRSTVGKFSIYLAYLRLTDRIKGIQTATWDKFAAILEKAGYKPPAEDPGPGAVVTFDEHGGAMVLISGARTPSEYARVIHKELATAPQE